MINSNHAELINLISQGASKPLRCTSATFFTEGQAFPDHINPKQIKPLIILFIYCLEIACFVFCDPDTLLS